MGEDLCRRYTLPKELLEKFVLREVKKALLESDVETHIADYIRRYINATTGGTEERLIEIDRQLVEIEEKENNVRRAMEKGVDPDFVLQSLQELQKGRSDLEEKRADLQNADRIVRLSDDDVANVCCAVGDYLQDLEETLEVGGAERKRDILRSIVDRVMLDRDQNEATVYIRRIPDLSGLSSFWNMLTVGRGGLIL